MLYVNGFGNFGNNAETLQLDPSNGSGVAPNPFATGLTSAYGITFGPDNNLYVSEFNPNDVMEFNGSTGAAMGVFATGGMSNPDGLAFGPDGNLYVSNYNGGAGGTVTKYNSSGAFLGTFISSGLAGAADVVFNGGFVYVSDFGNSDIVKYDSVGNSLGVFASGNGLGEPEQFAFGPDGNLYVASFNTNQVFEFNGTTGAFIQIFVNGAGLNGPTGLGFGPDGNLYVSNNTGTTGQPYVLKYDGTTGAPLGTLVTVGQYGNFTAPTFLTFHDPQAPEPGTLALTALLAAGLILARKKRIS